MTRFILAAVAVLLVWGLSLGLDLPLLVPIGVTGLVVLVLVGLHLLDRLREARRARALEAALAAQPVEAVRPDQVEELVRVRAEMAATVKTLGRRRLYRLPWFAIIGPPGAGKSTALRESGLTFPGVEASTGPLRGMGGTRNCDWWITNEGVILDTAGRWTSENEDRDEWLGFLDLLAAQRPKRPIDGLLVALPVDALVADEAAIEALAARLRDRVDEVQGRLKLGLPVYLLVTKCDLVAGFVETFGDLSKEDRGQMWGFTEPLAARGPARDRLQARFDELLAALDHRAGKRMGDERSVEARARIFAFPEEMASVREPLAQLVARLFAENIYAETPRLRGVYFTSGTQEGRSIDRVMHALADAMGMPHAAPAAAAPTPKSYFLRDLFTKVVFADVGLARWSEGEVRRQGRQQLVAAAAVLTLALGVAGLPLVAWRANASYLDETAAVVDEAGHVSDGDGPADPAQLASLGARARELRRFEEEGPPLSMRMGLYPEEVHPAFERLYLDTLRRAVVAPILDADADALGAFAARARGLGDAYRPAPREVVETFGALEMHLLLTGPPEPNEPALDEVLEDELTERLVARWAAMRGADRDARRAMEPHARYFVAALRDDPRLRLPRRIAEVEAAQSVLRDVEDVELATQVILGRIADEHGMPDATLPRLLGREVVSVRNDARVPAGFTRAAWQAHAQRMIEEDAALLFARPWVLGRPPVDARTVEAQVRMLRGHYLERYRDAWLAFVDGIEVVEVPATVRADQLLELTSGTPLLVQLVRGVADNVDLVGAAPAPPSQIAQRAQRAARLRLQRALNRVIPSEGAQTLAASATEGAARVISDDEAADRTAQARALRDRFAGFTSLAEAPANGSSPAVEYTEALDFYRVALVTPASASPAQRREEARALAVRIVEARPEPWRAPVRAILMPPLSE